MSSPNIEDLNKYYTYLDNMLIILCDIYKCPCATCIEENTERINSMISTIQEFYYFLIDCKKFIHKNESYLKKIKELIPNMILFNNVIIHDTVCINTQLGVSVIYIENETNEPDKTDDADNTELQQSTTIIFTLAKLFQYYPEMKVEFIL